MQFVTNLLDLGDIVQATGTLMRTRSGEISLDVAAITCSRRRFAAAREVARPSGY